MNDVVVDVKGLTKTYRLYKDNKQRILEGLFPFLKIQHKEFKALDQVSFQVRKGEIVGIIGKNGSGKSTLLKIITGVLNETEGSVKVSGRVSALLELGSGFNPEYTGIENIYMNGTLMGVTRDEMSKRLQDIVNFADIGDFINQPVKNYSSGMFVRLAFAVAINVDADILIVDEALAVGDVAFQAKCMAKMSQIMKNGTTILFVTHDMNTVKRLCQRCIYLDKGVKLMDGPAEEIADEYIHRMRADMNEENKNIDVDINENTANLIQKNELAKKVMEKNDDFEKRVAALREGTGAVRVINFQFTDMDNRPIKVADFNQKVKLRIAIEFYEEKQVGVGYHIRDNKNMELLGCYLRMEQPDAFIRGRKGDKFLVEFSTRLPVIEGAYSISLVVSEPIIYNRTSVFTDLIDNAEVFEVLENTKAKLWDKVYIKNEVEVTALD